MICMIFKVGRHGLRGYACRDLQQQDRVELTRGYRPKIHPTRAKNPPQEIRIATEGLEI